MQKWVLNITAILLLFVVPRLNGQNETTLLTKADSLYNKKKYAEAQQIYYQIFQIGYAAPSTLIKMAFVAEGLGDIPKALYFLRQYYNLTEDPKVYDKILVLSNAYNLVGYELSDLERVLIWVKNRSSAINLILIVSGVISLVVMLFLYSKFRKLESTKITFGVLSIFLFLLLLLHINLGQPSKKCVITAQTYLMNGPSAASNLMAILNGGNQLRIHGEHDVWVKVDWDGKSGYVKKNDLLIY